MQENSLMNISDFNISEVTPQTASALDIHSKIMTAEQTAATAMLSLCENLKRMRDEKLYTALGFDSFDIYTEQACGIKKRQAYNYIQTYEKLGKDLLQSNANLGITKLQLLTEVCAVDRQEFIEENDLDGMSVSEIKKIIAEHQNRGEQIDLLTAENSQLINENKELRNRPIEVAVEKPSKEDIDKAVEHIKQDYENQIKALKKDKSEAVKKAKADATKNIETEKNKAIEKAKQEEKERVSSLYEKRLADAEVVKKEAIEKAKELSLRLTNSADSELVTANVHFTTAQEQLALLKDYALKIKKSDPDKGKKLIDFVIKTLEAFISDINED